MPLLSCGVQLTLPFTAVPGKADLRTADGVPASQDQQTREPQRQPRSGPPPDRIHFVRTRRAKRYVLRVRPDGTLRVTVPRGGSQAEARRFVERQRAWIERELRATAARLDARQVADGASLMLRGMPARIGVTEANGTTIVTYADRQLVVSDSAADLGVALEQDLRRLAHEELVPRLHELAARHDLVVKRVTIRNQRSRWGSCSRAGVIALNYRLVQMPPDVRDYVIVHELMHLHQQNHSRRFWRLVEAACPTFRESERWLKAHGRALL